MTGFELSWDIQLQNPPMNLETEEVGLVMETPGFRGPYQPDFYENGQTYQATLKVPKNLADQMGNGSLVIEVEVDVKDGRTKEVYISKGGPKIYKVYDLLEKEV